MSAEVFIYAALDVGDVRIGVALSRSGVIAEPFATIERTSRTQTLDAIQKIIDDNGVTNLVVGLPTLESGLEGKQAEKSRAFARSLQRRIPRVRIDYFDERYTSGEARELAGRRISGGNQNGLVDRIAAAIILQGFLDHQASQKKNMQSEGVSGTS